MDSESIITTIGSFGCYQKSQLLFFSPLWIGTGIQILLTIFVVYVPDYRCAIPGWDNDTYKTQSNTHIWYINHTISSRDSHCHIYQRNASDYNVTSNDFSNLTSNNSNLKETECHSWVYDKSVRTQSASSQMNFVCENKMYISLINMLMMAGVLVGSLCIGIFSDKKGRKLALYVVLVMGIVSTVLVYFVNNIVFFIVLRFFIGASEVSIALVSFIVCMELITTPYRSSMGVLFHILISLGQIIVAGIAYFVRDWHLLSLAVSVIFLPYLASWCIIDESPRWLISSGQLDKAEAIFRKIAKRNGTKLPEVELTNRQVQTEEGPVKQSSLIDLFRSRVLLIRSLIIFFNWGAMDMVGYGFLLNAGLLTSDFYLSAFLASLIEIPAHIILYFTLDRLGRKPLYCSATILAGAACIASAFVQVWGKGLPWLASTLALIGKFATAGSTVIMGIRTTELFPTVVRNAGLGLSSCVGRIGGMVAPFIVQSGELIPSKFGVALPLVVFGIFCLVSGLLSLYLPETLGHILPETIEDGENFGRKKWLKKKSLRTDGIDGTYLKLS